MSARRENESPGGGHHRNGSNDSFPLSGLPLPPAPPMPPASMVSHIPPVVLAPSAPPPPRYAPADHAASPEITQPPNPLQQLLFDTQQRYLQTYGIPGQQPPPRPMAPPVHLMTPFPPRNGSLPPPPMPQTMQLPLPPSSLFPSLHGAVPPPPSPALSPPSSAVATAASLPPSVPSGPPPGVPITSDEFEYTGAGQSSEQLEVTAVTIYKSQRVSQWGNMIAVNGQFISYPIKDGLIRVLGQNSVDRLLLREHQGHSVADTAFFSGRTDLFLSAGTEGKVVVYQLLSDPTRFEPQHVIYTPLQRVIWHPFDANRIAIVNGDSVYVVYLTELPDNGNANETDIASAGIRCHQTASQINDVVFSPCGRFLVTGGADGFVHIYDLDTADIGESAELLHRFEPFDGGEVWSVLFYGGENDSTLGLLVGGAKNAKLSLWEDPLSEGGQPTWIQTVKISHASSEASVYDVVFDAGADFLFVTDRTRPVLFVLHLSSNDQDSARRFDNITEFDVTNPVLSGAIMMRPASRDASEFTHQFFTVQTTAIQRYNVSSTRCFVPRAHETDDDEDGVEDDEQSQSVGARTTEGHNDTVSFQAPAESPRATSSPETEVDIQTPQQNGDDESEYTSTQASAHISPLGSPRRTFFSNLPHLSTHEDASSLAGEDAAGSVRSYARSSPTSSVRALRDDTSQLGEMSIDESVISSDQVLAYLRRMEAAQIQRDEQARDAMQKMMLTFGNQIAAQASAQVDQTIQNQIQTKLVPAMGRIVLHTMEHNFMKPVLAGFERVVVERLVPQMEAKINESLQSTLPDQVRDGVSDMVDRVVDEVRQPVRESFKECFRDIIIPSFQAATQKMFEQIHEHVLKGAATSAAATRQNGSMDAEVLAQLRQLVGVVNGLSRKVDELQANTVIGNGHLPPSQETDPEQQRIAAQKEQLLAFIRAKDYEEAFKFALGAQNVSLVTFVCEQCDAREVLSARPPHLSQMIILCLVQQLGVDLADKLPVKIQWLRDALLVLNPRDPSNVGFVGSVLQELQSSLDQVPETDRDSQYTLVHHILKSLLSSV